MGSNGSRQRAGSGATDLLEGCAASGMGTLSFMSSDLFTYFLNFLGPEDLCRLSILNRFFHALLDPNGYAWRQVYLKSPFYDPEKAQETEKSEGDWKALYVSSVLVGWRLDASPLRCGEAFVLSKDRLGCRVDRAYKGPVLVQRVVTERGAWRGRHLFSVRVEDISPGSTSMGVCQGRHVPPHGYISSVGVFAGDGTLDTIVGATAIRAEGRIKGCRIVAGDVVTIDLDLDQREVSFYVNGLKWVTVTGVEINVESDPAPWYFYISVKNYTIPHIKGEQSYRIVDAPALRLPSQEEVAKKSWA